MNQYITGTAIRELREHQNMTQLQLAEILGVSDKTVSKWETGKGYPDITLLEPIADAFKVSVPELISGHRRHHASELAGKETMPVIVRDMDDDAATILMVDSNLQREEILPSERAKAYKMKLEAMNHQGVTFGQVGQKHSRDLMAEQMNESSRQIQRYIRLTNLIPELQDMVDEKKISFNPAVELSYLKPEEQKMFVEAMEASQIAPSLSQAQRMKKMSQQGQLTQEAMEDMLSEDKKAPLDRVVFDQSQIRKYFPKSYTTKQMQEKIIQLLEQWQRKQQRDMER